MAATISADEIAVYDRQIRLWGLQAQEKIRNAHILLITMRALGNEVAKNLVLAGVGSLTLFDATGVTEDDLGSQFLQEETTIGRSRAEAAVSALQKLNPRVLINVESNDVFSLEPPYFKRFSATIVTDLSIIHLSSINAAARLGNCPFYASGCHGLYGFVFADLIDHLFVISREKPNIPSKIGPETATRSIVSTAIQKENGKEVELVTKREVYQPLILANTSPLPPEFLNSSRRLRSVTALLPCLRALWEFEKTAMRHPSHAAEDLKLFTTLATEKSRELQLSGETLTSNFLRSFLQNLYAELAPVCAFIGGKLAQDVVNMLSGREQPIQNMMLFDGELTQAPVYALYPMVPTSNGPIEAERAF